MPPNFLLPLFPDAHATYHLRATSRFIISDFYRQSFLLPLHFPIFPFISSPISCMMIIKHELDKS